MKRLITLFISLSIIIGTLTVQAADGTFVPSGGNKVFGIYNSSPSVSYEVDVMFTSLTASSSFSVFDTKVTNTEGNDVWGISGFKCTKITNFLSNSYVFNCYKDTNVSITTNQWYNLKCVVTQGVGGYVEYFIDGTKVYTTKLTPPPVSIICVELSSSGSEFYYKDFETKTVYNNSIFDSEITRSPALSSRPSPATISSDFLSSNTHPRVITNAQGFEVLKNELVTNPSKQGWYQLLLSKANQLLYTKTLTYELRDGVRLMYVASDFEERMITLGMAYQLTGDTSYVNKAYDEMLSVASFSDWHPSHHIDTGIMAAGFAIGYDWFYNALTQSQRNTLEAGAKANGLIPIIASYTSTTSAMENAAYVQDNHNAMCNGGAIMLALALHDVYTDECDYILSNAVRGLEEIMWRYSPNGLWFEGAEYGAITLNYLSMAFSSMQSCLGTLYGLDTVDGFDNAYDYIASVQSDVGAFNFGDSDYMSQIYCYSGWICKHFGKSTNINLLINASGVTGEQLALALLWNSIDDKYESAEDALYNSSSSPTKINTMRNSATGAYVGIKAGDTVCEHSQLDIGSFVFDAMGVRWAQEMGKDDYNIQGFFDTTGPRWNVFLNRSEAHNTVVINPTTNISPDQTLGAGASFTNTQSIPSGGITTLDLGAVMSEQCNGAKRAFCFTDNRNSLVVRDELDLGGNQNNLYWLMYTRANYSTLDDGRILLTDKQSPHKKLIVEYVCNDGTNVIPTEVIYERAHEFVNRGVSGQCDNEGFYRFGIKASASSKVNITVKLTPINVYGDSVTNYDIPISDWSVNLINDNATVLDVNTTTSALAPNVVTDVSFDTKANISTLSASAINTNNLTIPHFNYSMNTDGKSDVVYVMANKGNRHGVISSNTASSSFSRIKALSEVVFCDRDTITKKGRIVRYDVDVAFPDFVQDKYIFETKYITGNLSTTWFASECLIVVPYSTDVGVLCVNDNRAQVLSIIEKDKWYHMSVEYDAELSEVRFYLSDELIATRSASNGISEVLKANIKLEGGSNSSYTYIDNFKVSVTPYPNSRLDIYSSPTTTRAFASTVDDAILYLANYAHDGRLISANAKTVDSIGSMMDATSVDSTLRAFLWDNMRPIK